MGKVFNENDKSQSRWDRDFGLTVEIGERATDKSYRDVYGHDLTKAGGFANLSEAEALATQEYTKQNIKGTAGTYMCVTTDY